MGDFIEKFLAVLTSWVLVIFFVLLFFAVGTGAIGDL